MSDRRRIIAALRAKADSTTFPAEAETLRAKADDLEAKLRAGERRTPPRFSNQAYSTSTTFTIRLGDVFTAAGGWVPGGDYRAPDARDGSMDEWMTVTDINGRTHRERIF